MGLGAVAFLRLLGFPHRDSGFGRLSVGRDLYCADNAGLCRGFGFSQSALRSRCDAVDVWRGVTFLAQGFASRAIDGTARGHHSDGGGHNARYGCGLLLGLESCRVFHLGLVVVLRFNRCVVKGLGSERLVANLSRSIGCRLACGRRLGDGAFVGAVAHDGLSIFR